MMPNFPWVKLTAVTLRPFTYLILLYHHLFAKCNQTVHWLWLIDACMTSKCGCDCTVHLRVMEVFIKLSTPSVKTAKLLQETGVSSKNKWKKWHYALYISDIFCFHTHKCNQNLPGRLIKFTVANVQHNISDIFNWHPKVFIFVNIQDYLSLLYLCIICVYV